MKIISTNVAELKIIKWRGKNVKTGIYKKPTSEPIYLGTEDVRDDEVSDRKHHGGIFKACYLFSADHYDYWKNLYPDLDWSYGMLGENLTISGLDESQLHVGDTYQIGDAVVQITQPREPCYKFGVKFGTQKVLKQFIKHGFPGTYVSVLREGFVEVGNDIKLIERAKDSLTVADFFELLFSREKNQEHLKLALQNESIPKSKRDKLSAYLTK